MGDSADTALLEARSLTANYGQLRALHGLTFQVAPGEVVVFLGANGAGKTTTLRAISQVVKTGGELWYEGNRLPRGKPEECVKLGIAMVPQGRGTFMDLTVENNLRAGSYITSRARCKENLSSAYEMFPVLSSRRKQVAGTLSGGEQQMLAIARALMSDPKLLLLDEPSLGLSPSIVELLFSSLKQLNDEQRISMLLVEQNTALALEIASRVYVLETGRIVTEGAADAIVQEEDLRRAYLGY